MRKIEFCSQFYHKLGPFRNVLCVMVLGWNHYSLCLVTTNCFDSLHTFFHYVLLYKAKNCITFKVLDFIFSHRIVIGFTPGETKGQYLSWGITFTMVMAWWLYSLLPHDSIFIASLYSTPCHCSLILIWISARLI